MKFYHHSARAQRSTFKLVVVFSLAIASVILANAWAFTGLHRLFYIFGKQTRPDVIFWGTLVASLLVILAGTYWRARSLAGGVDRILFDLAAIEVGSNAPPLAHQNSEDLWQASISSITDSNSYALWQTFRNVVEEMALAAGRPPPRAFVLPFSEINALAVGLNPSNDAIAITEGALAAFTRDELQAVVAHEMSHLLHGDTYLNFRLLSWTYGIEWLYLLGYKTLSSSMITLHDRSVLRQAGQLRGIGYAPVLWISSSILACVCMCVGWFGKLGAQLVKAAISRQREFLADAEAVRMTRSHSLADALKVIAGYARRDERVSALYKEMSHLFFYDQTDYADLPILNWLDTHPPLLKRIQAIEPTFHVEASANKNTFRHSHLSHPLALRAHQKTNTNLNTHHELTLSSATVHTQHIDLACSLATLLRERIPHSAENLPLIVAAIVISHNPASAHIQQQQILQQAYSQQQLLTFERLILPLLNERMRDITRLPLALRLIPELHQKLSTAERQHLLSTLNQLIHADGEITPFEYALGLLIARPLQDLTQGIAFQINEDSLLQRRPQIIMLLTVIAQYGGNPEPEHAFTAACLELGWQAIPYRALSNWIRILDHVLPQLSHLSYNACHSLSTALNTLLLHDNHLNTNETDFVRLVCHLLHCPVPNALFTQTATTT